MSKNISGYKKFPKPIADFQIYEKELINERRFGLVTRMCNKVLKLQKKTKRDLYVNLDDSKTKNGIISYNVYEKDTTLGINKNTLELGVMHLDKNNEVDGMILQGKLVKDKFISKSRSRLTI